jgi:hypothetical protein
MVSFFIAVSPLSGAPVSLSEREKLMIIGTRRM